jgi:TPP-dependent pyruvate/acetoin dehydrogenase alpha subunit
VATDEDPIDLYGYRLLERGQASLGELDAVHEAVRCEVLAAVERARQSPDAGLAELGLDQVYA